MKILNRFFIIILLIIAGNSIALAKTERIGTWIELEFKKDLIKQLSFSVVPEIRFQDQFNLDEYMVQGKLEYEPFSFLSLAGTYRVGTELKEKNNQNYTWIAFDLQASHEIDRFEASLRTRFTNTSESQEDEPGKYFRPRLKLEYNIKGNKITPFASYELFHSLNENELKKSRIDLGFTRKIGDLHRIGLYYRHQNYFTDKNSIHIAGIEYRLNF